MLISQASSQIDTAIHYIQQKLSSLSCRSSPFFIMICVAIIKSSAVLRRRKEDRGAEAVASSRQSRTVFVTGQQHTCSSCHQTTHSC